MEESTFQGWQKIVESHGFKVLPMGANKARVLGTVWHPEKNEHYDEVLERNEYGGFDTTLYLRGTLIKTGEGDYANIRHFLGY